MSGRHAAPGKRAASGESVAPDWEVDALDAKRFAGMMGPLFEQAPSFLSRLERGRPYGSWAGLLAAAQAIADTMPEVEQLELVDAHPRIGAPPETVSDLSFLEQGYATEHADRVLGHEGAVTSAGEAATDAEADRRRVAADLERLNAAYESRFGFRYVIFVAGRPRQAIVPLMEAALGAERDAERRRALRDVVAIARDRAIRTGLMPDDIGPDDGRAAPDGPAGGPDQGEATKTEEERE